MQIAWLFCACFKNYTFLSAPDLTKIRPLPLLDHSQKPNAAAQASFVSQSSLTQAIQQLETETEARLFDRHAKGMTLTHQGHQFLRQSYLILATVDNAKRSLQMGTENVTGQLTLGVTSLVAGYFLVDLLKQFNAYYPNVEVKVVEDERQYIEHPLLERESISLADIANEPLIQLNVDEMEKHAQRLWARAGLKPNIAMKTASTEAVRSLVAAGLGVSVQPDMAYRAWSLEGNMIEASKLEDSIEPLDIGLAWRRGSARPELVTPFLTIARENSAKRKPS
jgi:DNA-binding transcriptional LysR family regulator